MFKSKVLDTGDRFSFTFAKAGQFGYFCSLHPHMTGIIVDRNGSASGRRRTFLIADQNEAGSYRSRSVTVCEGQRG
ncbi:cupredoxin domain-containing protein [Sphingomonas hankyongi]|uniref:Blue (type 1) copper domain-containing protein n=1 Tax=Sphingomonas hankyongi TaxID=2908209 RepID=A0ABT0S2E1_9SPHN|nr:hypothetical protein [Sphingomonas hankyongi]MCL6729991.1 hypothetical protein [Sphingomonas hankyongi]